jgi:hypothetical protein
MNARPPLPMRMAGALLAMGIAGYLIAFAWRFADERLYADSGYYLIRTINEGAFHIEHGRWVLALAEWLPLLGARMGLPLHAVIVLHSLGNAAFLLLAMAYAWFVLKDARTLLALCAVQLIGLAHGLFCPVFELYYGVGLIIMLMATLESDRWEGRTRLFLAISLLLLALSSHPLAWLLLAGSFALLPHRVRRPFLLPALVVIVAFAIVRTSSISAYEAGQLAFVRRLFSTAPLELFGPSFIIDHASRAVRHYPDVLALAALTIAVLWRGAAWRAMLLFLFGLFALYIGTGLYLPDPAHDRYREQVDFGFAAWVLLVLFFGAWKLHAWRPAWLAMLFLATAFRIHEAERIAPHYRLRTAWERALVRIAQAHGSPKAAVAVGTLQFGTVHDRVTPYWSTGVETLLLSAERGPDATMSIITWEDLQATDAAIGPDAFVLRRWDVLPIAWLDRRWFRMDGRATYRPLPVTADAANH